MFALILELVLRYHLVDGNSCVLLQELNGEI
jgi:hypothetical protein